MTTAREPVIIHTGSIVGVDLGQANDPTAISVVKRFEARTVEPYPVNSREWRQGETRITARETRFTMGHLERVPLGTTYPDVVRRVQALVASPQLRTIRERTDWPLTGIDGHRFGSLSRGATVKAPDLVIDATGVGRPVFDMMRVAGLNPIGVTITGGDRATFAEGMWRVPKRDLVGALAVLLQSGRLSVAPALALAQTFISELLAFKVKIDPLTAHDSYGAWRDGEHDDLVLAGAIACWYGMRNDGTTSTGLRASDYRVARMR